MIGDTSNSILSRDPDLSHKKPRGNGWCLQRTMAEKNGESTPSKKPTSSIGLLLSIFRARFCWWESLRAPFLPTLR